MYKQIGASLAALRQTRRSFFIFFYFSFFFFYLFFSFFSFFFLTTVIRSHWKKILFFTNEFTLREDINVILYANSQPPPHFQLGWFIIVIDLEYLNKKLSQETMTQSFDLSFVHFFFISLFCFYNSKYLLAQSIFFLILRINLMT